MCISMMSWQFVLSGHVSHSTILWPFWFSWPSQCRVKSQIWNKNMRVISVSRKNREDRLLSLVYKDGQRGRFCERHLWSFWWPLRWTESVCNPLSPTKCPSYGLFTLTDSHSDTDTDSMKLYCKWISVNWDISKHFYASHILPGSRCRTRSRSV